MTMNPIFEEGIDEIIDKRRTHRGVAYCSFVYHKVSHDSCNVCVEEFQAGFLTNPLMNKEVNAIKITSRHNGKQLVRSKTIPWTYQ